MEVHYSVLGYWRAAGNGPASNGHCRLVGSAEFLDSPIARALLEAPASAELTDADY